MREQEKTLQCKTSIILGKDTSQMRLNDIIEELVNIIETEKICKNDSDPKLAYFASVMGKTGLFGDND